MPVVFKAIIPKNIDQKAALDVFREVIREEIQAADIEFAKTYATWRHKPDFEQEFKESANRLEGSIMTSGDGSGDNPYPFVTKGTAVRYATMTPGFEAKTTKRVIGSGGGQGGVMYIDKRRPRKGIEAREFEDEIERQEQPKFENRARKALSTLIKRSGHEI
jgi:hypothetical protein